MAIEIRGRARYYIEGKHPGTQSCGTRTNPAGAGRNKLNKSGPLGHIFQTQFERSLAGMRKMIVGPTGKRRWVPMNQERNQ